MDSGSYSNGLSEHLRRTTIKLNTDKKVYLVYYFSNIVYLQLKGGVLVCKGKAIQYLKTSRSGTLTFCVKLKLRSH